MQSKLPSAEANCYCSVSIAMIAQLLRVWSTAAAVAAAAVVNR